MSIWPRKNPGAIPRNRTDHSVYFNPSDLEFPIAFKPFGERATRRPTVGFFRRSSARFTSIWRDSGGPINEYILYNGHSALLDCQNTPYLRKPYAHGESIVPGYPASEEIRFIKEFWEHELSRLMNTASSEKRFATDSNTLGQFLLDPVIRTFSCSEMQADFPFYHRHTNDFSSANLSQRQIGHDKATPPCRCFVLISAAAMRRAIPSRKMTPRLPHLLIDDFKTSRLDAVPSSLPEARKYVSVSHCPPIR